MEVEGQWKFVCPYCILERQPRVFTADDLHKVTRHMSDHMTAPTYKAFVPTLNRICEKKCIPGSALPTMKQLKAVMLVGEEEQGELGSGEVVGSSGASMVAGPSGGH